jgi:hypothetical protein
MAALNLKKTIVIFLLIIIMLCGALPGISCVSNSKAEVGNGLVITSMSAEHTAVYPLGNTRITCNAVVNSASTLKYQWVSNYGTIIGEGQTITWEAPKTYGDFHIMCTVVDTQGNKTSQTITIAVLVRDPNNPTCCR